MKSAIFAIALLSGTAALAQTEVAPLPMDPAMATPTANSTGPVAAPGNAAPERDARGIAVISDAADVPAGYNGTAGSMTGMGGPLLDTAGAPASTPDASYPACTRTVTDNCVQTYERHRR